MQPARPDVRIRATLTALLAATALLVGACDVGSSEQATGGPPTLAPGATPTDIPIGPDDTGPVSTDDLGIPGFDGWHLVNAQDVQIGSTDAGLAMTLVKRALWFQTSKGVLFYRLMSGDFRVTSTVETQKTSDSTQDPGGNGTVQLAGIMARAQTPSENYVFIAVGSDANGLSVETKSTTNGDSHFEGPSWPSGDAELKLCRIGGTFTLWKRQVNSSDDFTLAATFRRDNMTGELQVGANIYSDSTPDITALFPDLTVEPLDPGEAC